MNEQIKTLPDDDYKKEELLEVGKWLDEDKEYKLSTHEKQSEFARKRNYPTEWDDWKSIK
jgi:hypothetical protein